jgi:HSP20 family protein
MAKEAKEKEREKKEVAPYRPGRGIPSVFDEMDRLFGRFLGRRFGHMGWPRMWWPEELEVPWPSVDIYDEKESVVVKAEIPGVRKEELEVNVTEDAVTISGEKKKEEKKEEKDYYRLERSYGSFRRSFPLPADVDSSKAKAKFKDGVLEVTIPKTEKAKKKEIKVTVE